VLSSTRAPHPRRRARVGRRDLRPARLVPVDVTSVDLALSTTRSVRRRIDWERPVEREVILQCIDVATQAPTGLDAEAWRFLILERPEQKARMAEIYRAALAEMRTARAEYARRTGVEPPTLKPAQRALADRLHEMPALILVCSQGRFDPQRDSVARQVGFYGSVLPAAWSLMVALRTRGIGATWTSLHLMREHETARAFGIPDDVTQTVLLPIGYTRDAVLRPAARRPARQVTFWDAWGAPEPADADLP